MSEPLHPVKPILMVDDEEQFLLSAGVTLAGKGLTNVIECADSTKVMALLKKTEVAMVVLDLIMPGISGLELLEQIHREYPDLIVVMLTAINEVETAVKCMQSGAFDYILKPVDPARLTTTIKTALTFQQMREENIRLKQSFLTGSLKQPGHFSKIITQNEQMKSIFRYIEAVAPGPLPVLITGDTGVGKELIAEAIHLASDRSGNYVAINVAGLDDHLFSDTLFGHKKGAFTGADRDRPGLIEKAAGGTLFLDEIGDLRPESQVKLLRLLQENSSYYPIGSDVPRECSARIICATNVNLQELQKSGDFRKDLFYRLQTHHIRIPSLQERKDDIAVLLQFFFEKAARKLNKKQPQVPPELLTLLSNYPFPGNIRELESMVYDALSRHQSGRISLMAFRDKIRLNMPEMYSEACEPPESAMAGEWKFPDPLPSLKDFEQRLIDEALKRTGGNQRQAAELLGLSRRALNNRIQRSQEK